MNNLLTFTAQEAKRLDLFLSENCPELSRSRAQTLIKEGRVFGDDQPLNKAGYITIPGQKITVDIPAVEPLTVKPENIPLNVVYEDSSLIIVNKPQNMVVHPAPGHSSGTLVNALLAHCGDLSGINGLIRPGIVHRIDKDTSGLLVVAKNDAAHLGLSEQWQKHDIKRIYHAVLQGVMSENIGIIEAPIGRHGRDRVKMAVDPKKGRAAITHYQVVQRFAGHSHVELTLKTGRTHQIRVHMAHLGHPVLGDKLYGTRKQAIYDAGQVLHAKVLGFKHPLSGEYMEFESPLPPYFEQVLADLAR